MRLIHRASLHSTLRAARLLAPLGVLLGACIAACEPGSTTDSRAPSASEQEDLNHVASTAEALSGAQFDESSADVIKKCDQAVGVSVPAFDCDADDPDGTSTLVPDGHPTLPFYSSSTRCDYPNHLNRECDPGSRFHVLVNNASAYIVAHCRKKGATDGGYNDVAVIQHSVTNGATCFYQSGVGWGPSSTVHNQHINAPSDPNGSAVPLVQSPGGCVNCHSDGALIRSPYLAQLVGQQNAIPGAGDDSFNRDQPYRLVGNAISDLKVYKVTTDDATCTSCHRIGLTSLGGGIATRFAMEAVEANDVHLANAAPWSSSDFTTFHKNADSSQSPLWMTPDFGKASKHTEAFNQANANSAQSVARCAANFKQGQPNSAQPQDPSCAITQYSLPPYGAFPKNTAMWLEAADASVHVPIFGPFLSFATMSLPDQSPNHNSAGSVSGVQFPSIGHDANGTYLKFAPASGSCQKLQVADSASLQMGTDDFALIVVADYADTPNTAAGFVMKQLASSPWRGIGMYGSLQGPGAFGGQLGGDIQKVWTSLHTFGGPPYVQVTVGNWGDDPGTTAAPHVFVMRRINGNFEVRVDGSPGFSSAVAASGIDVSAAGAPLEIGCRGTTTHPLTARIYSIGLVRAAVDDTTIKAFEASLKLRYNL